MWIKRGVEKRRKLTEAQLLYISGKTSTSSAVYAWVGINVDLRRHLLDFCHCIQGGRNGPRALVTGVDAILIGRIPLLPLTITRREFHPMLTTVRPAFQLKDMSLFRQQRFIDGKWTASTSNPAGFEATMPSRRVARWHFCSAMTDRYGADGYGPSLKISDPEGNVVELKGPSTRAGK